MSKFLPNSHVGRKVSYDPYNKWPKNAKSKQQSTSIITELLNGQLRV